MEDIRERVAIFMEFNNVLTQLENKEWYEVEDGIVEFVKREIAKYKEEYETNLNNLVGKRFETLEDLKEVISLLSGKKCITCIESESETEKGTDNMIDFEFEDDDDVYTLFYLKDNANNYYITEV